MYVIPYTQKRAVVTADRDATVSAARTGWGKRRAERFFARFLQGEKPPLICDILHPIASSRYERIQRTNTLIHDLKPADVLSNQALTPEELKYVEAMRQ